MPTNNPRKLGGHIFGFKFIMEINTDYYFWYFTYTFFGEKIDFSNDNFSDRHNDFNRNTFNTTSKRKKIWVTFLIASILVATLFLIEWIQMKWDFSETLFTGRSKVVIENGVLNEHNLKKLRMSVDKLEMRLRQNGISSIEDLKWATVEPSGQLGYLLTNKKQFATKEDVDEIHEILTALVSQLNLDMSEQQIKNQPNKPGSNIFSEIEEGHSPPPPKHLE